MELGCLHKSSKVQWNLVSYTFKLVKTSENNSNEELRHSLVKMLSVISKLYLQDTNMKRICDHHSMQVWNFIQEPNQTGLHVDLETALKPFLKNTAQTVTVTDEMIQNHEKHFFTEDVLVNAIIDQIMNSGFWCKEHEKLMKIEKGIW